MKCKTLLALSLSVFSFAAAAQQIYPIDRATMIVDGQFDFKVEFDEIITPETMNITINGQDFRQVLKGDYEFVPQEKDVAASAVWIRNASINKAGEYQVVVDTAGEKTAVKWNISLTPKRAKAKNVIFILGDGMSVAHRTGARILSRGVTEGKANGRLAIDDLKRMAFIGTSSTNSIAADSANTMSAYMTGHKSAVNALGVYESRVKDTLAHPKQETIAELIRRQTNMSVGIVTDSELQDATPAAVVAHTRRRADKAEITGMLYDVQPDVLLGGGSAYFLPKSVPGSKRKDDINYIDTFRNAGYDLVTDATELKNRDKKNKKLLGLFHTGNMNDVLDRRFLKNDATKKFPNQPDLTEMTKTALDVLSQNKDGFFLMIESALIDKASHPLDWERAIYNTIMLDQVTKIAMDYAKKDPDTLIIVTADHTHGISLIGTVDDNKPGTEMREKVGVYEHAGYPNYQINPETGYPEDVNVSKRLAVFFASFPDYYETFRPKLDGLFVPAIQNEKKQYIANEQYKTADAMFRQGNIPRNTDTGVHSMDDVVMQADGPGSENIYGYMENSDIFKVIADALALSHKRKK